MRAKAAVLVLFVLASLVVAQEPGPGQGQGQPRPAPNPQPTVPTPGTTPQPGTQPQPPRFPTDDTRDPFARGRGIQGKIIPSPSMRLRVDLYDGGIRLDTTYTDLDGAFRFERYQPGRRYEIHIDVGPGKEYVEEVDFSYSFPVMIHMRPQGIRDTGFGGEKGKGGGTLISLTSLQVPKNAAKELEKGRQARAKNNIDEALQRLRKATELYPKYAEAYNELGLVYRKQNQPEEARKAFEQAISVDPDWVNSYLNLANMQLAAKQNEQLLETSNKVLKLNPSLGPGHFFQSMAQFNLGRLDEAEKSALEADRTDHAQVPAIHLVLYNIYMNKGAPAEAVKQLRTFLKENPNAQNAAEIKAQIEKLQGK